MSCQSSCIEYDEWLDPETDWQTPNPCDTCEALPTGDATK